MLDYIFYMNVSSNSILSVGRPGLIFPYMYVWKYQPSYCYFKPMEISIRISTNYIPFLFSSFGNAKLFCIMNWPLFSEGSSTQFKTKLALIGFILWHLWESENQHSLSTVVKCQISGRFIVNVQKNIVLAQIIV